MHINLHDKKVGDDHPIFITAEIGINHNGDIELAKQLIDKAIDAGANAVKFQKRTIDTVYNPEELARPRENPFGSTNGDLKRGLEFGQKEYEEIDRYCKEKKILWYSSCWDEDSVDFMEQFNPPCYKIASPSLTDHNLLKHHVKYNRPIIISTGMSTLDEIDAAIKILDKNKLIILHCTSTYPSEPRELNLRTINSLKKRYSIPVGYSGHEVGLATSLAAATLGACMIERHITLDRAMWGSDHAASVEPGGIARLIKDVRAIEQALGDGVKKIYDSEKPIIEKLRRKHYKDNK